MEIASERKTGDAFVKLKAPIPYNPLPSYREGRGWVWQ